MSASLTLVLQNDIAEVARVLEAVAAFTEENQIGENGAFKLNLVLDELVTNILSHGCRDRPDCRVGLKVQYEAGVIRVDLVDNGVPFNPIGAEMPRLGTSVEDARVGGLGVRLVRKYANHTEYAHVAGNNRFHFTMTGR